MVFIYIDIYAFIDSCFGKSNLVKTTVNDVSTGTERLAGIYNVFVVRT